MEIKELPKLTQLKRAQSEVVAKKRGLFAADLEKAQELPDNYNYELARIITLRKYYCSQDLRECHCFFSLNNLLRYISSFGITFIYFYNNYTHDLKKCIIDFFYIIFTYLSIKQILFYSNILLYKVFISIVSIDNNLLRYISSSDIITPRI